MNNYMIIANPTAGSSAGKRAIPQIERLFAKYQLNFNLVCTERPWHAAKLAKEAVDADYNVIIAAGGDGTSNEVINCLMEAKLEGKRALTLGVLGVGRGSDFAYGVNIPYDLEHACQVLVEDHRRAIDIGRVVGGKYPQGRYFSNCVGVGFDAIGTIEAAKLPRRQPGLVTGFAAAHRWDSL